MADLIFPADLSVIERTRVPLDTTPGLPQDAPPSKGLEWLLAKLPSGFATVLKRLLPAAVDYTLVKNFKMEVQCQSLWCWAAVASSIAKCFNSGSNCEQCKIAHNQLPNYDCCSHPCNIPNLEYDQPKKLSLALQFVDCLDGPVSTGKPELKIVRAQIDQQKPVAVRMVWGGSPAEDSRDGAHFVVIVGFLPGTNLIAIQDPATGDKTYPGIDYDGFPSNYCSNYYGPKATWGNTYYTKAGYKNCAP